MMLSWVTIWIRIVLAVHCLYIGTTMRRREIWNVDAILYILALVYKQALSRRKANLPVEHDFESRNCQLELVKVRKRIEC